MNAWDLRPSHSDTLAVICFIYQYYYMYCDVIIMIALTMFYSLFPMRFFLIHMERLAKK